MEPLILTVDDHQDHCLLMASLLDDLGYQSISTTDGKTALKLAQTHQPALILLDICMPCMDGNEVIRRLKQNFQTASIPVVAVTAMVINQYEQLLATGYDGYLIKPFTLVSLEHILQHHLVVSPAP